MPNVINDANDETKVTQLSGGAAMDDIWADEPEGEAAPEVAAAPVATPVPVAPVATPVPAVAPTAPAIDPLTGIPKSLLGIQEAAPVVAPAANKPDYAAEDAAYDQETAKTAARFSNVEQKRAFFTVRNEAKAERLKAREAHSKVQEMSAKLQDIEQKLAKSPSAQTMQQPTVVPAELQSKLADLEKKNQDYEERLGKLDLTQSEGFYKQYVAPKQGLANKLVKLLTNGNRPAEQAVRLVNQILSQGNQDEQLALVAEDSMAVQGAVLNVLGDLSEVVENEKIAVENWKLSKAAVQAEQDRKSKLAFMGNIFNHTDEAVKTLAQEGNFLLSPVEGNVEWNAAVEQRIAAARGILQSADDKTLSKYVVDGVTAPFLRQSYMTLVHAYQKLQADAAGLVRGAAGISPSGSPAGAPPIAAKPVTANEALSSVWGDE